MQTIETKDEERPAHACIRGVVFATSTLTYTLQALAAT